VETMRIQSTTGNVGIGTTSPQYPLSVNGVIQAKEVLVNTGWSDYVFAPNFHLRKFRPAPSELLRCDWSGPAPPHAHAGRRPVSMGIFHKPTCFKPTCFTPGCRLGRSRKQTCHSSFMSRR